MKTALLCVLLGIFTMLKAEERSLDMDKFSGFWYEVGMSSNSKMLLKKKDTKRLGAIIITPVENGLQLKIISDEDHICVREDFLGVQSEIPEKFIVSETREYLVLDTDYDSYAIMKLSYEDKGLKHHVLQLLCRDLDLVLEGFKKLRKTSEHFGVSKRNAMVFLYDDTCPKILMKVNPFVSLLFIELDSRGDMTSIAQDTGTIVTHHNCLAFGSSVEDCILVTSGERVTCLASSDSKM